MTREEALSKTLTALHKIAMGVSAMRRIDGGTLPKNEVLRQSVLDRAMSDGDVERLALDVWEEVVTQVEPKLPGTTIFECGAKDIEP